MDAVETSEDLTPQLATPSLILDGPERILIYGPGKTGKTFTAATSPEPQWWLTPGGTDELKTAFGKGFIAKHGMKERYITSVLEDRVKGQMVDNPPGYDRCCDALDRFLEWNDREGIGIKTIIIDNATILEEYMMNKAIQAEYDMADSKTKTVLKIERDLGIRKPHDSTYGAAQSFMARWVAWLSELPFHLVFVAHDYIITTKVEGSRERKIKYIRPAFVGAQRTDIPKMFSSVWYSQVSGGGRGRTWGIQSEGDPIILAGTRVGGILDANGESDPNITDIIEQFAQHAASLEKE